MAHWAQRRRIKSEKMDLGMAWTDFGAKSTRASHKVELLRLTWKPEAQELGHQPKATSNFQYRNN